jgi:hypothetical protein
VCGVSSVSPQVAPESSTVLPITLFQAGTGLRQGHETLCRSLGSSCSIRSDRGELSHPAQHRCRSQPEAQRAAGTFRDYGYAVFDIVVTIIVSLALWIFAVIVPLIFAAIPYHEVFG